MIYDADSKLIDNKILKKLFDRSLVENFISRPFSTPPVNNSIILN